MSPCQVTVYPIKIGKIPKCTLITRTTSVYFVWNTSRYCRLVVSCSLENMTPDMITYGMSFDVVGLVEGFNATFNNISVISWRSVLLMEATGENHRPVACHWQTLSHYVVSSTRMSGIRTHNVSGAWITIKVNRKNV